MCAAETKERQRRDAKGACDYDAMPYFCSSFSQTHPNRLAVLAGLFGVAAAPVNQCRVLELGCGTGGNLIPMAYGLPKSQFVGVDLSANEINSANQYVHSLQLANITFKHANILDIDAAYGEFDYIIAHGVYSWVPKEVQQKMLAIIRDHLQPNGVAYVSYNVLPGWHFYNSVREMMRYHVRDIKHIPQAVQAAREFLQQLALSVPDHLQSYKTSLMNEVQRFQKITRDDYIWHDMLAECNQPFYFHEFNQQVEQANLQYLADADFHTMMPNHFNHHAFHFLEYAGTEDIIQIEQYMDFVRNRSFRESLLCHQDVTLKREMDIGSLMRCYYTSSLQPVSASPAIQSAKEEEFKDAAGHVVSSSEPLVKATWCYLSECSPQQVSFAALLQGVQSLLGHEPIAQEQLLTHLWECYSRKIIDLYKEPAVIAKRYGEYPVASAVVRYEAARQSLVTNMLHEQVEIDSFTQYLLPLLSGEHSYHDVLRKLNQLAAQGKLTIQSANGQATTPAMIEEKLDIILRRCVALGMLIE